MSSFADPELAVRRHRHLRRYVLAGEKVTVATRLHWSKLVEPVVTTIAVTMLVAWLHSTTQVGWVWILWAPVVARLVLRWAEWHYEWFVATDKRLLLSYGFIIHKVAMMPMTKVTDMGYTRTLMGQLLGYGRFVMESAGQDQVLRQIDRVPDADQTYRTLCDTIFSPKPPSAQGDQPPRPPAIVPSERAARRPGTAEIPVVAAGEPAPATGSPTTLEDHPTSTAEPATVGPSDVLRSWRRARRRRSGRDDAEESTGGTTVPDPFL
ncbi:PH domain-containing protein [Isoptericola sediminis]|uniref:PH domain-containing protein n=1 Tax=Isoptericola sediminis TaxID=2733572 RepID=A0A849K3A1_9MICO|nr:PH domain-containing protein [Isoptericola sediminis]NNU27748.1 PH domain-containing protein [Isoptericola sediminis]